MPVNEVVVTGGVDTHKNTHYGAVIDRSGALLGEKEFGVSQRDYHDLLIWMNSFGTLDAVGVEGTGSYGSGLTTHLTTCGVDVLEVRKPNKEIRYFKGKSDALDAYAAAKSALNGQNTATPKTKSGTTESIRVLRIARSSAVKERGKLYTTLKTTLQTAPASLRAGLEPLSRKQLTTTCAALRPDTSRLSDPLQATKMALRSLAKRVQSLDDEIKDLDISLGALIKEFAPSLTEQLGVGNEFAGQLLVSAGENITRFASESAFAHFCGVAPIPASSGQTRRQRLNRGGDRQANRALHGIVVVRMNYCEKTKCYVEKRTAEGLSKREIMRCLKRYVAREIYSLLKREYSRRLGVDGI